MHKIIVITTNALGMNQLRVEVIDHSQMPDPNISAYFHDDPFKIVFSRQWIAVSDIVNIAFLAFQQVRFAYQHYQILIKDIGKRTYFYEDSERIERWRKDIEICRNSGASDDNDNDDENDKAKKVRKNTYLEIHIDAMAFANFLIRRLVDEEFEVPWTIKDKVIARQIEFEKQFKNEKIFKNNRIIKFSEIIK